MAGWQSIRDDLVATSVKQRLHGLEVLLALTGSESLPIEEFADFVDLCGNLLTDSNFKVAQQTLQALSLLVCKEPDAIKPYANSIVPLVAERLADARQPVRQDACEVLLKLLAALRPENVIPRLARFWTHRSWKVRHGMLQTIAEAVSSRIPGLLNHKDQNTYIVTQVVNLVEDQNETVRDAALDCLQELYRALEGTLLDNLKKQSIRPAALREVAARLDQVAPCNILIPAEGGASPGMSGRHSSRVEDLQGDVSSRADAASSASSGQGKPGPSGSGAARKPVSSKDAGDAPAPPVTLGSERELSGELEAMMPLLSSLLPDWQLRIGAMARLEGIARGSPALADALVEMLKPMKDALMKQIEDRRSAVNKQACRTLTVLSSVLGLKFQDHAIFFLPIVFRVLPITVQVMAEASDQCCQAILQTCQSHRLLPVLLQTASKDKNNKIRALCCGYVAQVVENWEPQVYLRCAEDLEAMMKSAAQDASAEARQAARRTFAAYFCKTPDQAVAFLNRLDSGLRDKLSKGSIGGAAAGDSRPASAASSGGPQRPKMARKPLPGFAAAKAAAAAAGEVQVFVAERPATATFRAAPGVSTSADISVAAPSRPWSAQVPRSADAGAGAAPSGPSYGVTTVHAMPPSGQALSSSMPAPLPKPRMSLGGAALAALGPGGPPPRAPSATGVSSSAPGLPPSGVPHPAASGTTSGTATGHAERTASAPAGGTGAGGSLSQRGPYRSSSAAELPPMERLPQTAGGRKSIGFFGPARVPGPGALGSSSAYGVEASSGSASSAGHATSAAFAHALMHGGPMPLPGGGAAAGSTDLASLSAASAAAPKLKAGRRSTGGIGLMAAGLGGLPYQQAMRVPSAEAPSASASLNSSFNPNANSYASSHAGAAQSLSAEQGAGASASGAGAFGSPARRVTVSGHAGEASGGGGGGSSYQDPSGGGASVAGSGVGSSVGPSGSGMQTMGSSRSTGSWGMGSNGSGGQAPVWGVGSINHGNATGGPLQPPTWQQQQAAAIAAAAAAAPTMSTKQSVGKVVTGLVSGPKSWSEKVQALSTLSGLLEQVAAESGRDQGSDCGRDLERLSPKLLEFVEDSHHKVAGAALEVLRAALRAQPRALDGAVERLMPAVFLRTADAKDALRMLAASALADCSAAFPADILLLGLSRSLDACKLPRTRLTVLEYACQHVGHGRPGGAPTNATLTKQWLRQLSALLTDKNLDVRRAAVEATEALYQSVDAGLVIQYASFATGPEALALKRVLTGLSDRLGGAPSSPGPDAMEVDGVAVGVSGGGNMLSRGDVGSMGAGMAAVAVRGTEDAASPPEAVTKGKGSYAARDYMSPMRVDVERIADVGLPTPTAMAAAGMAPAPMVQICLPAAGAGAGMGYGTAPWGLPPGAGVGMGPGMKSVGTTHAHTQAQSVPTMDVQAASRHVSLLVYRLQMATGPDLEQDAWQRLTDCVEAGQAPAAAWEGSSAQLRMSLGRALRGGAVPVRRAAAGLLGAMAAAQPVLLQRGLLAAVVPALLAMAAGMAAEAATEAAQGLKDEEVASRLAAKSAYDTLVQVLEAAPAATAVELLAPQLPSEDADVSGRSGAVAGPNPLAAKAMEDMDPEMLAAVVRCMHTALRRLEVGAAAVAAGGMTQQEAEAMAERLLATVVPGVRCSLGHARADIRKASVFCLVELWCKLGEGLEPYLAPLSDAQRKLVDIYFRRACGVA